MGGFFFRRIKEYDKQDGTNPPKLYAEEETVFTYTLNFLLAEQVISEGNDWWS